MIAHGDLQAQQRPTRRLTGMRRLVIALEKALGVECTAFLQEPAPALPAGPGRPRKPTAESAEQQPKRPRGRPRKAPAAAQETPEKSTATSAPSGQDKSATGQ